MQVHLTTKRRADKKRGRDAAMGAVALGGPGGDRRQPQQRSSIEHRAFGITESRQRLVDGGHRHRAEQVPSRCVVAPTQRQPAEVLHKESLHLAMQQRENDERRRVALMLREASGVTALTPLPEDRHQYSSHSRYQIDRRSEALDRDRRERDRDRDSSLKLHHPLEMTAVLADDGRSDDLGKGKDKHNDRAKAMDKAKEKKAKKKAKKRKHAKDD